MIYVLLGLLFSLSLSGVESITNFHSDITIHVDGSMTVHEAITVNAEGDQIRRGIVREFPTTYKDRNGNRYTVRFDIIDVRMNGKPVNFFVEVASNGKKLNFGDDSFIRRGVHTYEAEYATNRQLGFFKDHDELYWNVTGNGWRLPIDRASATVHLPKGIPANKISVEGYTGYQGTQAQHYTARVLADGTAFFETTNPLKVNQGFTIVVAFPKGYVQEPTALQSWRWFFTDNLHLLIAALGLLFLIAFYWWASITVSSTQGMGAIIPLFYPPKNMTPGLVRYIANMKYDAKVLAADIVDMAVKGYLSIEHKPAMVWGGSYTLHKKRQPEVSNSLYLSLYKELFSNKDTIVLSSNNRLILQSIVKDVENNCSEMSKGLFDFNGFYTMGGVGIAIASLLAMLSFIHSDTLFWLYIAGIVYAFIIFNMASWLRGYTKKGLLAKKEIVGFEMFLKTTEEERLKIVGSPPTKSPELYETYLPYAIALGVEKQWSRQFAPMFEKMAAAGEAYSFIWISGGRYNRFGSSDFASNISNSISSSVSSAISSSSSTPGSSSGFGGGGSSGGGGGGGGGGGR